MTFPPRIALVPLDERPVNTGLVKDVAALAGVHLELPPAEMLPRFRTPGDVGALARWLSTRADEGTPLVVSIDTLVFGGLIPSRTSSEGCAEALKRLDLIRRIRRRHPGLLISAVSLVMRASDSYSDVEEPTYWSRVGRELHAVGGAVHREWLSVPGLEGPFVPDDVRVDYAARRLRNHVVTLASLGMKWDGTIDHLVITADDTAAFSAGSAEQRLIDYWQRLRDADPVIVYPGADETGAVLVARMLAADHEITVSIHPGDPAGMLLVPNYENVSLAESAGRQTRAVGARLTDSPSDLALVIHTPDPQRDDQFGRRTPTPDLDAVAATVAVVEALLAEHDHVILADLRYSNGADPALTAVLSERGLLQRLSAYSGWNTAGNALGGVLALGVAAVVGERTGRLDRRTVARVLTRRVLDDAVYQSEVRRELHDELLGDTISPLDDADLQAAEQLVSSRLIERAEQLGWATPVAHATLPWRRSFEVDIRLVGEHE